MRRRCDPVPSRIFIARALAARHDAFMALTHLVLVVLVGAPFDSAQGKPCSAPEYRQFDFWVGEWDVKTPKGTIAGTNRIERIEGGCALQENWRGTNNTGRSINAY